MSTEIFNRRGRPQLPYLLSGRNGTSSLNRLIQAIQDYYGEDSLIPTASMPAAEDHPGRTVVEIATAGVLATLSTSMTGADNDITLTALVPGVAGNDITITLTDPSGNDEALAITVVGTDIDVSLATGSGGAITTTATELVAALNADAEVAALLTAAVKSGDDGSGAVTALTETALATGADPIGEVKISDGSTWRTVSGGSYTVATVPPAASMPGATIYVADGATGSPCAAVSNGTNWLVVTVGSAIAAS